jgi:hypothetical protein
MGWFSWVGYTPQEQRQSGICGLGVGGWQGEGSVTQGKSCLLAKMRHTQSLNSSSASMRWRSAAASPMRSLCWNQRHTGEG